MSWKSVLKLSSDRHPVAGGAAELAAAVARGADLRVATVFRHEEHIQPGSLERDVVRESMRFDVTYLIDGHWAAGICTRRQPVQIPDGFGPRPSMSFFLYNQDASQAVARLHLDGPPTRGAPGPSPIEAPAGMTKYHQHDHWDAQTNAPSQNFVYDFDSYDFLVNDQWQSALHHAADGSVISGSTDALTAAVDGGANVKVAISGVCADLAPHAGPSLPHQVILGTVATYYYMGRRLFIAATQPLVRVRPRIPLRYSTRAWDFGWLVVRSDGVVSGLMYDPYTLEHRRSAMHCEIQWFVDQA